ncbi:MAG: hypothetical protein RRY20_07620 [Bilophila sp.]
MCRLTTVPIPWCSPALSVRVVLGQKGRGVLGSLVLVAADGRLSGEPWALEFGGVWQAHMFTQNQLQ